MKNMKCLDSYQFPAEVYFGGQQQIPNSGQVLHLHSKLLATDKDCLGKSGQGSFCDKNPYNPFQ